MPSTDSTHRLAACTREQDKKAFALGDAGTHSKAVVTVGSRKCQKVQVDGALEEIQPVKCDWCIRDKATGECLFVELKGKDCLHAAEQIACTIDWFQKNTRPFIRHRTAYIVAHAGIPGTNTQLQLAMARMAKRACVKLQCIHSPANLIFE